MNIPDPCNSCGFLYYDATFSDSDLSGESGVECVKNLIMGNPNCPKYKSYKLVSSDEKWRKE